MIDQFALLPDALSRDEELELEFAKSEGGLKIWP